MVYGDLKLSKTLGVSPEHAPIFVSNNAFGYVSGNCINFVDFNSAEREQSKRFVAKAPISAWAVYRKDNVIAYAENYSSEIRFIRSSNFEEVQSSLKVDKDVAIVSLAFSADGRYLAALGDYPSHYISVWEWKSGNLVGQASNETPASQVSFNPLNANEMCVSGNGGALKFWKIDAGYQKISLKSIKGDEVISTGSTGSETSLMSSLTRSDAGFKKTLHTKRIVPTQHSWTTDSSIISVSEDAETLVEITSSSGHCDVVCVTSKNVNSLGDLMELSMSLSSSTQKSRISAFAEIPMTENSMGVAMFDKDGFYVGSKDGKLYVVNDLGNPKVRKILEMGSSAIKHLVPSPNYLDVLAVTEEGNVWRYNVSAEQVSLIIENPAYSVAAVDIFRLQNVLVSCNKNGKITGYDLVVKDQVFKLQVNASFTTLKCYPFGNVFAVGSDKGVLRVYEFSQNNRPRLIQRVKSHVAPIREISFDPTGRYLTSISTDSKVFVYDIQQQFSVLGYIDVAAGINGAAWSVESSDNSVNLFVLSSSDESTSKISRFSFPVDGSIKADLADRFGISHTSLSAMHYNMDGVAYGLSLPRAEFTRGRQMFYIHGADHKVKLYAAPVNSADGSQKKSEQLSLGEPVHQLPGHQHIDATLVTSFDGDKLVTYSSDGHFTVRNIINPEQSVQSFAHDSYQEGVKSLAMSNDLKFIVTAGGDGSMNIWEWTYPTASAKKLAAEAAKAANASVESQKAIIDNFAESIQKQSTFEETPDSAEEKSIAQKSESGNQEKGANKELEAFRTSIEGKINSVREKIVQLMQKNESLPELERLDRQEFIIDYEERDRLKALADQRVEQVRKDIEEENMKKRVVRNRLKREFWDSMTTVGQSIRSFNTDSVTGKAIEVQNYPIRKQPEDDAQRIKKIKLLRRVQLMVNAATKAEQKGTEPTTTEEGEDRAPTEISWKDYAKAGNKVLLYGPFELITNERRRTQMALLSEVNLDIKAQFNQKFKDMAKLKQDEMLKIDEKNDRMAEIMTELQVSETLVKPMLHDDEVPERVIQVRDEEVTVERFITPEERRKLEEKRRQEEERMRAAKEDNYKERALVAMMNGKLEDKSEQEEKEVLVRPDWMSKPKEEMTEDEKKQVKEFEKKMALFKEEQEKQRKALETELRKLQSSVTELCAAYDERLKEFFFAKMTTDQQVYLNELKVIKLSQIAVFTEDDEDKEAALLKRMEVLKQEKTACANEIPEIKRDLERCREQYDGAVKRDKEIEKQFKKEFHQLENHFEVLMKLFKRREVDATEENGSNLEQNMSRNPFGANADNQSGASSGEIVSFPPLVREVDFPQGLSDEVWYRLVDMRDRKINAEQEVRVRQRRFNDMQHLVQKIVAESERIRAESEKVANELNEFMEYRFHNTYNVESFFQLKQGQVEVPQAPIVTDYSDSLLIHRSVVENLNESIAHRGKSKIDALKEIKDYRKGIHALEWENKMIDFQAEDLVIRIRDIQLLRVTKQMQHYLQGNEDYKQQTEVNQLERRGEYNSKAYQQKLEEKEKAVSKYDARIKEIREENSRLDVALRELELSVTDRKKIADGQAKKQKFGHVQEKKLEEAMQHRKLVDVAKSQAQDLAVLREEVEKLRAKTFPMFPSVRPPF